MNLDQIETKCFILALFIRDDGERFLLGSRMFEFVDSQLHFTANVYQNDVVEVQGNDGLMLAGQVRRGNSQAFDGYIGDSSVDKATIEQNRRDFMKFFRKNHYYKVVYIFPDKTAIQRRQGFIVEAPEVKELYQLFPQYHISMNFEDINYYNYEEDSEGEEIYGESATLKVATSATGGLIWADNEQETVTEEGTSFTIQNTSSGTTLSSVQLKGDTEQNGTPTPDSPVAIQTVTGSQVVTITDGGSQSQSYTIDLGSIELCKIGTYQDYIYKSGYDWYLHKEIGKIDLSSIEWYKAYTNLRGTRQVPNVKYTSDNTQLGTGLAINYIMHTGSGMGNPEALNHIAIDVSQVSVHTGSDDLDPTGLFYYALATATDTQITNASLISQLNALAGATTYNGSTVFTLSSENQLAILRVAVLAGLGGGVVWDEYGATWEEGTGWGPTMISVDSIDNVYPVWELTGPATNPQISVLTTNTTLSYSGTVTASQTLKIDMFNKTATLNGTSVVGNVSGDWVYLAPGTNRVTYTTGNADAPDSTIWWQEIVG